MAISRIWQAFGLKPHRTETFKLSPDPLLIDEVRDIVGLYLQPPTHAVVYCVDVKPQIQALDRTAPLLPLQPGQVERRTHDCKRHGTTSLYAALNVDTGTVMAQTFSRQRTREFRAFLGRIDANVPTELDVHIILDNASAHKSALIRNWLVRHPRFQFHFTPTYASWMNLVERWFAALTTKQLPRGAHHSVRELIAAIQAFIDVHNETGKPYVWVKNADEILASISSSETVPLSKPSAHRRTISARRTKPTGRVRERARDSSSTRALAPRSSGCSERPRGMISPWSGGRWREHTVSSLPRQYISGTLHIGKL